MDLGLVSFLFVIYLAVTVTAYDVVPLRKVASVVLLFSALPVFVAGFSVMVGAGHKAPRLLGAAIAIATISYFSP